MKKIILFTLLITGISATKAQDAKKVFSTTDIVWYGMDFTKAKFVGGFDQIQGAGNVTGTDMRNKWVPGWNTLLLNEPQNFDLRKTFRKDNIYNDITSVTDLNSKLDADKCMTYNEGKIERSEIDAMVKKYTGDKKDGIGLVFIIENFNKGTQTANVYVTFFDIATKKVLVCEKVDGKAVGIGMRNYWAGAIKSVLKQVEKELYNNWKSKY